MMDFNFRVGSDLHPAAGIIWHRSGSVNTSLDNHLDHQAVGALRTANTFVYRDGHLLLTLKLICPRP